MDARIDALTSQISQGVEGISERREMGIDIVRKQDGPDFASELGKAIGEVDRLQVAADQQANAVAHGAGNLHEMAIALEKADVSMRLAMRVRTKLVDTYNDIMRMGI